MFALTTLTQRLRRAPQKPATAPVAVKAGNALIVRAAHVFHAQPQRNGKTVYLLNADDKVISLRAEYCDHSFKEHTQIVNYRANVFNTRTKQVRFVDLAPGMLMQVK